MFLKDGGGLDKLSPKRLLNVNFKYPEMQLGKKDIFVGGRVRSFIKKWVSGVTVQRLLIFQKCDKILSQKYNKADQVFQDSTF